MLSCFNLRCFVYVIYIKLFNEFKVSSYCLQTGLDYLIEAAHFATNRLDLVKENMLLPY